MKQSFESSTAAYLAESHGDSAIIGAGRETSGSSSTSCSRNASLRRTVALCAAATEKTTDSSSTSVAALATAKESTKKLALLSLLLDVVFNANTARRAVVDRRRGASTHESTDHDSCIDGTIALSATERSGLSTGDVAVTNDGSVRLGTAAARGW
jgi:hypothetical protein